MVRSHCERPWTWRVATAGALAAASLLTLPGAAHAGFLDFLFGGVQQPAPPVNSYPEPPAPMSSRRGPDGTREDGGGGGAEEAVTSPIACGFATGITSRSSTWPTRRRSRLCRAMCPASKTKVFFGSGIDHAAARDGQRYTDLDSAYAYRDHFVANCTCNGRDALGLAPFEATSDPTLRAGDIVATKGGLLAYTGGRGQGAAFAPVDEAAVTAELNRASSRARLTRRAAPRRPPKRSRA